MHPHINPPRNWAGRFSAKASKARRKSLVVMHRAWATASALDRFLDRHGPFHGEHALGHGVGVVGAGDDLGGKVGGFLQQDVGGDDA